MSLVHLAHFCSHLQNASKARLGLTSVKLTKYNVMLALAMQKQGFFGSVTIGGRQPPIPFAQGQHPSSDPYLVRNDDESSSTEDTASDAGSSIYGGDFEAPAEGGERLYTESEVEVRIRQDYQRKGLPAPSSELIHAIIQSKFRGLDAALEDRPWLLFHSQEAPKDSPLKLLPPNPANRRLWLGLKYHNQVPVLSQMKAISKPTKRITLKYDALSKIVLGRHADYIDGLRRPGECLFVMTDRGMLESREAVEKRTGGLVFCRVV